MSHVDEGLLHAWLDRPRSGLNPEEAADIEGHLAECAACSGLLQRVTLERDAAEGILASAGAVRVDAPEFAEVIGRRGGAAAIARPRHRRGVLLLWAASITIAVGLGWLTRDLLQPRQFALWEASDAPSVEAAESRAAAADAPARGDANAASAGGAGADVVGPTVENGPATAGIPATQRAGGPGVPEEAARTGNETRARSGATAADAGDQPIAGSGRAPAGARIVAVDAEPVRIASAPAGAPVPPPPAAPPLAQGFGVDQAPPAAPTPPAAAARSSGVDQSPAAGAGTADALARGRAVEPLLIRGRVTDPTGAPLGSVQLYSAELGWTALSGPDGTFSAPLDRAGATPSEVTIVAQRIGYARESVVLTPERGDTIAVISLRPTALAFQEIIATGAPTSNSGAGAVAAPGGGALGAVARAEGPWQSIDRAAAERLLGRALPVVPELEIGRIEAGDGPAFPVRVLQRTESGEPFTITIARVERGAPEPAQAPLVASEVRGDLRITVTADLPPGEMDALLRRIR